MTFMAGSGSTRGGASVQTEEAGEAQDWGHQEAPGRDWKKLVLVIGLGILSWVATYVGMLELIQSNMGDLPLVHKMIVGFSVAMLMTMIIWLLDQIFAPIGFFNRLVYIGGYVFLTLISVGFGFGFYWKVLESRSETTRSAESAVTQVQSALHGASTRLEQLQGTLIQLTEVSTRKAEEERTAGSSCPNSRPGDGPRRKLRDDDAARFAFASEFVKGRVTRIKTDVTALNAELVKIASGDKATIDVKDGTRNDFMRALSRKLDMTVTGFNAFRTDPQLRQIRADLGDRADKTVFPDTKGGTFACPDPQLQTALRGVVRAIDQLPEVEKPKVAAVEGSEATIEAFRRLTATFFGALTFKMPPSAEELRQLQQKAVQSVESPALAARLAAASETVGLSKRDYIPLAIAVFVDLCLLLVSMGRPVHNRLHNLVPKMQAAERGPVYQILSKFSDIHKDETTREKFEIFRHVVFDYNGDFYVAVPLDAPRRANPEARLKLQQEAHLLANLFASFEKEKIFKRSMLPTNATIRRKLDRQGSKFAGSESFRVYRFRDGAWSDIILGAVMGASRKVEGDRRRTRLARGHELDWPMSAGQVPSAPAARTAAHMPGETGTRPGGDPARTGLADGGFPQMPSAGAARAWADEAAVAAAPMPAARSASARRREGRSPVPSHIPAHVSAALGQRSGAPAHDVRFGKYAAGASAELGLAYGADLADGRRPAGQHDYRRLASALDTVRAARDEVTEADVSFIAAGNSNTAPPTGDALGRSGTTPMPPPASMAPLPDSPPRFLRGAEPIAEAPAAAENVVPIRPQIQVGHAAPFAPYALPESANGSAADPAPHPIVPVDATPVDETTRQASHSRVSLGADGGHVDVVVSRETATFRLPVSEGRLPQMLARMVAAPVDAATVTATDVDEASHAASDSEATILLPAPADHAGLAQATEDDAGWAVALAESVDHAEQADDTLEPGDGNEDGSVNGASHRALG